LQQLLQKGWGTKVIDRLAKICKRSSRGRGLQPAQSQIHAVVCRGLDRGANCAAACCTIALGPPHGLARPSQRPAYSGIVRQGSCRTWVEAQCPGASHLYPAAGAAGKSAHQFLPHPAPRRFGSGGTDPKRPLQLRLSHPASTAKESELERRLLTQLRDLLLELGRGFAFAAVRCRWRWVAGAFISTCFSIISACTATS
jgi:hypothetical protein